MEIPQSQNVISFTKVKLPYGWLGNMSPYPVQYDGVWWLTAEALFQALRFPPDSPVRKIIHGQKAPMAAKMLARKHRAERTVEPLSEQDFANMRLCLQLKAKAHRTIREQLMATGDKILVEDVSSRPRKNDPWGMKLVGGTWKGENLLGNIWMELRAELKKKSD